MVEVPKAVVYAILALITIAILILLAMFFISTGGGDETLIANFTDWSGKWKW